MRVSFNENANEIIRDNVTLWQRKSMWYTDRNIEKFGLLISDVRHETFPFGIGDNEESETSIRERHDKIRRFVRFVVAEYKSLKSMGYENDSISLYRISYACSKADAKKARERAADGTMPTKSTSCSTLLRERHCTRRKSNDRNEILSLSI